MPWIIPLITIATSILGKDAERRKARNASLNGELQDIADQRTQQLGGNPYSAGVGRFAIDHQRTMSGVNNAGSTLGTALQAYSAIDGIGKGDAGDSQAKAGAARLTSALGDPSNIVGSDDRGDYDEWKRRADRDPRSF